MKIFWTKEALLRLQEIEEYISIDNPVGAIEFVDKLISLAETLIDNPEKGRIVPELSFRASHSASSSWSFLQWFLHYPVRELDNLLISYHFSNLRLFYQPRIDTPTSPVP